MIPKLYEAKESNFEHNGLGLLTDTISCVITEEQNGMYELELTYKVGSFLCKSLVEDNIVKAKANNEHDPQLFRIYYVSEEINGTILVKAEHISYDLRGNFLESIFLSNTTCQQAGEEAFNKLEESHNFTFYSDIEHTANYNISRANGLECIVGKRGSLLDTFGNGAKLIRDNYNISLVKNRGINNNVLISYKKNMTGYKRELDLTDLVTKIYPFAIVQKEIGTEDNPQTIEELIVLPERFLTSSNYNKYANGKILAVDYSDQEGIDTIEKLRNISSKFFTETDRDEPNINYQVEFVDLSKTTEYKDLGLDKLEKICLDDTVIIRDSRFNRDVEARVIKTVYNSLTERYESLELGKFKDSLKVTDSDLNEKVDSSLNSIKNMLVRFEVLDDKVVSEISRLEGDVKANTTLIEQTDSYIQSVVTDMDGKYTSIKQTIDEIDLTGVVKFSDLSTKGGTTIHGGNITTGTITATQIASNTITGDEIKAGSITSSELSSDCIKVGNITQADSQSKAYINVFNNMSIDGSKGAFRFQYDSNNYLYVDGGQFEYYSSSGGSSSPTWGFYGGTTTQTMYTPSNTFTVNSSGISISKGGITSTGTSSLKYINCSGSSTISTIYSSTIENSGYIYTSNLGAYSSAITMRCALNGNGQNLGYSGSKFYQVSAQYVWGDSGSVSDIRTKENIRYLDNKTLDLEEDNQDTVTKAELFNFINNLKLCEYNYKEEYRLDDKIDNKIGFVANDVVGDKIGDKIVGEHEGYLTYNLNNMVFATIGALQEEIRLRDSQIEELQDKLDKIINHLNL